MSAVHIFPTFCCSFIILCISQALSKELQHILMTPSNIVRINESVTITCEKKNYGEKGDETMLIFRGRKGQPLSAKEHMTEGCHLHARSLRYSTTCSDDTPIARSKYVNLTIQSVQWEDSLYYDCVKDMETFSMFLNVFEPAKMNHLLVNGVALNGSHLAPASKGGTFYGIGTRTNPFDLRSRNVHANISCSTTCGYPQSHFDWSFVSITGGPESPTPVPIVNDTFIVTHHDMCSNLPIPAENGTKQKIRSESAFLVDCGKMKWTGLVQVTCRIYGDQYVPSTPSELISRSMYFVCPGGQRPMDLTLGETIAIIVGCVLSVVFLIWGCINGRRHFKDGYHQPLSGMSDSLSQGATLHV